MLADTAVTGVPKIARRYSSVGQLHETVDGRTVQEGILKIIAIRDEILLCYSGSGRWALAVADFIASCYSAGMSLSLIMKRTATSIGPFPENDPVTMLIAMRAAGEASLHSWQSRMPDEIIPILDFSSIGSLKTHHVQLTQDMLSFLTRRYSSNHFPLIVSLVQSYGIHENLIQHKVGGIVFGAALTAEGIRWQPDTSYLLYDKDLTDISIVTCLSRDNVLAVYSSITKERYLFHHYMQGFSPQTWITKWESRLFKYFNERKSQFYSFIRKSDRNIVIIRVRSGFPDCRYFRIKHMHGDEYEVAISPELMQLLLLEFNRPDGIPADTTPIGFSYYEA